LRSENDAVEDSEHDSKGDPEDIPEHDPEVDREQDPEDDAEDISTLEFDQPPNPIPEGIKQATLNLMARVRAMPREWLHEGE
jgi:hypothetical protein